MAESTVDVVVANRFISSLSKSLQALCHGCMDFNTGIEIVGYININIDSGSKVDYVLNEKVLKSTTNSMTFVSNSFLAKKDQQKQLRDGACSPVEELQQSFSNNRQRNPYNHSGLQHHRSVFPYSSQSHVLRGAHKRTWNGGDRDWRLSPKKHSRGAKSSFSRSQEKFESSSSKFLPETSSVTGATNSSFLQPDISSSYSSTDNSRVGLNIKTECPESHELVETDPSLNANESTDINIKQDPDAIPETKAESTAFTTSETTADLKHSFLDKLDDQNKDTGESEQSTSFPDDFTNSGILPSESDDVFNNLAHASASTYQADDSNLTSDMHVQFQGENDISYPQSSLTEQGEESGDGSQFDVIEIGDEDEDVQAMFGDDQMRSLNESSQVHSQSLSSNMEPYNFGNLPSSSRLTSQCHYCHITVQSYLLKQHTSQYHGDIMPFTCKICGKGYGSASGLSHHVKAHEGKVYNCPVCDVMFSQTGAIKRHLKRIHKSNQCNQCRNVFKLGADFEHHVRNCGPLS